MKRSTILLSILLSAPSAGHAAPGLDDEVYGATIDAGKTEIEARYGRLIGSQGSEQDVLVLEGAHGFSSGFYGAILGSFGRDGGNRRRLETVGMEGIFSFGHVRSLHLDATAYVEVEHEIHGRDNLEAKLLLQHHRGPFETRLNLIVERALTTRAPVNLGYAVSVDYHLSEDVGVGAEAFGDLGNSSKIRTHEKHFVGPTAKVELDHVEPGELELRAGYLFAIGGSRADASGQLRLGLEYEF